MTATRAPTPADDVAQIAQDLHTLIDARMRAQPALAAMFLYVFLRITRLRDRLVRFAARIRAATQPPSGVRATRIPMGRSARPRPPRAPVQWSRKFGALADMLGGDGLPLAERLQALLADPEFAAFMVANKRFGRCLRPLCRTLGVPLIPALRLPRRLRTYKPKPRPAPVQPATPPPGRHVETTFTPTGQDTRTRERAARTLDYLRLFVR